MGRARTAYRIAGAAALLLALTACAGAAADTPSGSSNARPTSSPGPFDPSATTSSPGPFDPAATTRLWFPTPSFDRPTVPLLVLVPGGGWQTHDSAGMKPLARQLRDAGYLVATTEYRAGVDGIGFPTTLQDVLCSAAYAEALASTSDPKPGPVVLIGHSAGGHLSALAGVSGTALARTCDQPIPPIAGVVGLAGIYDAQSFQPMMTPWFGTVRASDEARWDAGDPLHYVTNGKAPKGLHVLLVHGDDDGVVPLDQSRTFDAALRAAGVPVQLDVLPGASHMSVLDPDLVAQPIEQWLAQWAT